MTGKDESMEVTFKLNEEFSFVHPFLNETVMVRLG
jgi:hypothetical protein